MVRQKATAGFWVTPSPQSTLDDKCRSRRSNRLRAARTKHQIPTNRQLKCPLFGIPAELRNMIFNLALTFYEDPARPRDQSDNYHEYRPGHFHYLRADTALIRTCQLIHAETHLSVAATNLHTLFYNYRRAASSPIGTIGRKYFSRLTAAQLVAVQSVHIFAHRDQLRARDPGTYFSNTAFADYGCLRHTKGAITQRGVHRGSVAAGIDGPYPKALTITIRHVDWFTGPYQVWDSLGLEHMLANKHWENIFGGLECLSMELEVEEKKRERLEPLLLRLKNFVFDIGHDQGLVAEHAVKERQWRGRIRRMPQVPGDDHIWEETVFNIVTITWRSRSLAE
ncbi:MAG: hypothetical protein Q9164_002307 [Protoblastenia rupestris]